MDFLLAAAAELVILYYLSRTLTRAISFVCHTFTGSKKITVYTLAVIFLPGTIVHELSHYLMARILLVYAGKIRLLPQDSGKDIKMGSVLIGKTDPVRRFLIGAAPFLTGTAILLVSAYSLVHYGQLQNAWYVTAVVYTVFEIGNSMFSSAKDMEGTFLLLSVTAAIMLLLYAAGVRISLQGMFDSPQTVTVLEKISTYLALPVIVDAVLICLLYILGRRVRVIRK